MKPSTPPAAPHPHSTWALPLVLLVALLGAGAIAYAATFVSMVETWWRSETFAHGFLIVPIVLFLVWLKRAALAEVRPRPNALALLPIAALGLLWTMGELVDVLSVRQFAATLTLPAIVWLVLGSAAVRILQFPLAYLLFAVPFGNFLVPPLMAFTADFTVSAVQLSGIPVYREGLHFELPSGRWSVVEACSGVRYLIASVALGTLYAYLIYRGRWRRLAFIAAAIVVPIIANGVRAYLIVMVGHWSGMELAAGVDHLIYGWLFFGLVIFLMFWIGTFWRQDGDRFAPAPRAGVRRRQESQAAPPVAALLAVTVTGAALLAAAPAYAAWMNSRDLGEVVGLDDGPLELAEWAAPSSDAPPAWQPGYRSARAERGGWVSDGERAVGLHLAYYREQHRYGSLVGWANTVAGRHRPEWHQRAHGRVDIGIGSRGERLLLRGPDRQRLVVWRWYWSGGALTTSPHEVKLREALSRLRGGRDDAALIVFYAAYEDAPETAEAALERYATAAFPKILERLDRVYRP